MTTHVQSVILSKDKYKTREQADKEIKKLGFKTKFYSKGVDETSQSWRYRQASPKRFSEYKTKKVNDSISLVLGIK